MANKRRKIILSRNNLDPLSRWYFSRINFGDANGNKASNPVGLINIGGERVAPDRRLYVSPTRDAGLNAGEAHVKWNLAGANNNGEPNPPNAQDLRNFVTAALADDIGRFLEFTQGNNQFIFTEKAIGTAEERYSSFASEMLTSLLTTSEYALQEIINVESQAHQELSQYSIRNINGNVAISRTFTSFASALEAAQFDFNGQTFGNFFLDNTYNPFRDAIAGGGDGLELNLSLFITAIYAQISILGNTAQVKALAKYFVFTEVLKILPESLYSDLLRANDAYDHRHHYAEIETPYVSTKESYSYLEEVSTGEPFRAGLNSDYSFFSRNFEENTQTSDIPETILPNIYTRNYYKALARERERGSFRENSVPDMKYQEFKNILGLFGEIKQESLDGIYESFFYNSYGLEAPDLEISDNDFFTIDSKNQSIIMDSFRVRDGGLQGGFPPMSIGVEFTRDGLGSYQEILDGFDEDDEIQDITSIVFENIERSPNNFGLARTLYSTQYLTNNGSNIIEKESSFSDVQLRNFTLDELILSFEDGMGDGENYRSLVLGSNLDEKLIPRDDDIELVLDAFLTKANRNSRMSYGAIIGGEESRNESLGYRISKRTADRIITQNFYIGNGAGDKVVTYNDSQIKYGKEYDYTLSEYRLVYGTKYKFRVVSPDLPLWVMENYLGLSNNFNEKIREIEISQVREFGQDFNPLPIPNISFNAYIQEEAAPIITEVPIYDEFFNSENVFVNLPEDEQTGVLGSEIGGQGSISYPSAKVLDRPPTAPVLDIFPMVGVRDQIKVSVNLQTGNNTSPNSREIVSIGDLTDKIRELKNYQDTYVERTLPPNHLEYKNEGLAELRNIIVYRTTELDLAVSDYNEIYKSFNPETNPNVSVRKFTDRNINSEQDENIVRVQSYDLRDNLQPNINYYYTCVVEDFHGNPSNPSIIYRVRLLFDKGLLIPEIDTVLPIGEGNHKPQKNVAQYIKIDASNIQTLPYVNNSEDGFVSERSLGTSLDKPIENQSYILRLTSKDTGRKFDVKLNFIVRVDGSPINQGT